MKLLTRKVVSIGSSRGVTIPVNLHRNQEYLTIVILEKEDKIVIEEMIKRNFKYG